MFPLPPAPGNAASVTMWNFENMISRPYESHSESARNFLIPENLRTKSESRIFYFAQLLLENVERTHDTQPWAVVAEVTSCASFARVHECGQLRISALGNVDRVDARKWGLRRERGVSDGVFRSWHCAAPRRSTSSFRNAFGTLRGASKQVVSVDEVSGVRL